MADEEKTVDFNLTLDPGGASAAAAAAEAVPALVLGNEPPAAAQDEAAQDVPVEKLDIDSLSPAEQAAGRSGFSYRKRYGIL